MRYIKFVITSNEHGNQSVYYEKFNKISNQELSNYTQMYNDNATCKWYSVSKAEYEAEKMPIDDDIYSYY